MGSVPVSIDPPVELFSGREHVSSSWLAIRESCSYSFSVGNKLGELLTETKFRDDDAPVSFAVVEQQTLIFVLLRTFAPIVCAYPYCARKFTCHAMHRARALSTKLNNNRADGHCYIFAWI